MTVFRRYRIARSYFSRRAAIRHAIRRDWRSIAIYRGCRFGYHRYIYVGEHRKTLRFGFSGWNHECDRCGRRCWSAKRLDGGENA